mgnify:CR=1 FL=1
MKLLLCITGVSLVCVCVCVCTGLHDYSPFLALHTVLDFWQNIGQDAILEYTHGLCRQAGRGSLITVTK